MHNAYFNDDCNVNSAVSISGKIINVYACISACITLLVLKLILIKILRIKTKLIKII